MVATRRAPGLLGRTREREILDGLLASARGGRSGVLVIRGDAGIGKTALLRYAASAATDFRVAQIAAVGAEMELPFAAIHQLCAPMLDQRGALPAPQRNALDVAFGLSEGDTPDRFLIALAVLSLLSAVAEERPLACFVDDANWLDDASEQVLGFVARRLLAEPVALVFAVREPWPRRVLDSVPQLLLTGLDTEDARKLVARAVPGHLDNDVRDRLVAETGGNPLALLELPRATSAAELAGGFHVPGPHGVPAHVEDQFLRRVRALPADTQRLILLAAADSVGDATLVWRAADRLGIKESALAPARESDLLEIAAQVRFRHPLVRSAVYRGASAEDRQRVHEALAEVSDAEHDADRRAWHRALAAAGPDEEVAAELERSARSARQRGGLAAAAAFLERSAALTPDPLRRAERELGAAQAKHQVGDDDAAEALLARAQWGPLDSLHRAQGDVLRGQIAFTTHRARDAYVSLLDAAKQLELLDATLAREAYLEALRAAQMVGRLAPRAVEEVAQAARAAPPSPSPRPPDLLLDALALTIAENHGAAAPRLRLALDAFLDNDAQADEGFRWLWLARVAALELWDYAAWHELCARWLPLVRKAGAMSTLPLALSSYINVQLMDGNFDAAAMLIDEARVAGEVTGIGLGPYNNAALLLAAWRGDEATLSPLLDTTVESLLRRDDGFGVSVCHWYRSLLHNGLGQYERALAAAKEVVEPDRKLDATIQVALPELIEAAVRSGEVELGRRGLDRLTVTTRAAGMDWGLGLEARSRALVSDPEEAEPHYQEAIDRLGRTGVRADHARAHLLYGEWLRRQGRRIDAREQLRTAHRMFDEMGIDGFGERARRELVATGEKVRKRVADTRDDLTPQELQIAVLAREGLSNPEIGARLFLSPRTVEWHLHRVFSKLGIRSRRELPQALPVAGRPSHDQAT